MGPASRSGGLGNGKKAGGMSEGEFHRDALGGEYRSYSMGLASIAAEAVLAAQKHAMELVLQRAPLAEVLRNLATMVEDAADGDASAAILLCDTSGRLRTVSAPSLPAPFTEALDHLTTSGAFAFTSAMTAAVVAPDMAADPAWTPVRGFLERLRLQSAWCCPIVTQGNGVLGVFITFFRERRRPSALELRLVETLSQTAVMAIDRQDAENVVASQQLIINELTHRVKNTMATVQAIAVQALKRSNDPETARGTFESRLHSLATAHDLLTLSNWSGAGLREIVDQAIQPFSPSRFDVTGPDVHIPPRHALAFAMAIHELATNAVKHGALSVAKGRVLLTWRVESGRLTFTWREEGGPKVKVPTRRGFGTQLLERAISHDLGGAAALLYAPEGVRWDAVASLAPT